MNIPGNVAAGGLLIANTIWDIRKREILLLPTFLVLAGGLIWNGAAAEEGLLFRGLAILPGVILILLSIVTDGKIGFGDGLCVCAAGSWCGAEYMLVTLFFALLLVPTAAVLMHLRKKPVRELPFLPFLLTGFFLAQLVLREG